MQMPRPLPSSVTAPHHYPVRSEENKKLHITNEVLSCLFDLTLMQAGEVLGICHTTTKRIRAWSGMKRWPRNQILRGTHPKHSMKSVQRTRDAIMMRAAAEGDACLYRALFTASCLAFRNCETKLAVANAGRRVRKAAKSKPDKAASDMLPDKQDEVVADAGAEEEEHAELDDKDDQKDDSTVAAELEDSLSVEEAELEDSLFDGLPFFDGLTSPPHDGHEGSWLGGWQYTP